MHLLISHPFVLFGVDTSAAGLCDVLELRLSTFVYLAARRVRDIKINLSATPMTNKPILLSVIFLK